MKLRASDGGLELTAPVGSEPRGLIFDGTYILGADFGDTTVNRYKPTAPS